MNLQVNSNSQSVQPAQLKAASAPLAQAQAPASIKSDVLGKDKFLKTTLAAGAGAIAGGAVLYGPMALIGVGFSPLGGSVKGALIEPFKDPSARKAMIALAAFGAVTGAIAVQHAETPEGGMGYGLLAGLATGAAVGTMAGIATQGPAGAIKLAFQGLALGGALGAITGLAAKSAIGD